MGRTKTTWGADVEERIRQGIARGRTAAEISRELSAAGIKGASRATIDRRMRELRGKSAPPRVPRARASAPPKVDAAPSPAPSTPPVPSPDEAPPLPSSVDDVPEEVDLTTLDRWIVMADNAGRVAEAMGDLAGIGAMGRLLARLLADKARFAPPKVEDPNDHPDMKMMGARCVERMHDLIDKVAPK